MAAARELRYNSRSAVYGDLAYDLDREVRERALRHAGEAPRHQTAVEAVPKAKPRVRSLSKAQVRQRQKVSVLSVLGVGAAIGLGFLQEYEGLFISKLLPLFAVVALLANALGWLSHRQWYRSLLGMVGPAIVLAAMLLFFGNWWTANLLYVGLALMIGVSIWDLLSPANRRCELPPKHG